LCSPHYSMELRFRREIENGWRSASLCTICATPTARYAFDWATTVLHYTILLTQHRPSALNRRPMPYPPYTIPEPTSDKPLAQCAMIRAVPAPPLRLRDRRHRWTTTALRTAAQPTIPGVAQSGAVLAPLALPANYSRATKYTCGRGGIMPTMAPLHQKTHLKATHSSHIVCIRISMATLCQPRGAIR